MSTTATTNIDHLLSLNTTDPSAALEFRRGIFELLGCVVVKEEYKDMMTLGYPMATGYRMVLPEPNSDYHLGHWRSEDEAWKQGMRFAGIPDYLNSVDAALTLPLEEGWQLQINYLPPDTLVYISKPTVRSDMPGPIWSGEADMPAFAVCRAWLRYRRAQSAPVATADEEVAND